LIIGIEQWTSILAVGKSQIAAKLGPFGKYSGSILKVCKSDGGESCKRSVGLIV
jgi:hypothetical protein